MTVLITVYAAQKAVLSGAVPETLSKLVTCRTHQGLGDIRVLFSDNCKLSDHNLGDLMLKALNHLSIRLLVAINLICHLLKMNATLISISEQPVYLVVHDHEDSYAYGEVNVDQLINMPRELMLSAWVTVTHELLRVVA